MVDFTLTDEQQSMREMAHDFAEKEIRPVAWEYDRDGTWPQTIIDKAWELGLMNNHFPVEYGGPGLGYFEGCIIEEELAWGCSGISTSVTCNGLATAPVLLAASEEIKKEYIGRLSEAPLLASFCLTEPDAGSDVGAVRTKATPAGDGTWRITGQKIFITYGEHDMADNIVHLVLARVPDAPPGTRGISCFVVPKTLVGPDGVLGERNRVSCVSIEQKLGIHASPTCVLEFDQAEGYLIGEPNEGMRYMFTMMNNARLFVGVQGLAVASRAYQQAVAYRWHLPDAAAVRGWIAAYAEAFAPPAGRQPQ